METGIDIPKDDIPKDDIPKDDIPKDWQRLADSLVRSQWRRVVVLGASDRGKSTFCRFLAQQLVDAGIGVCLLDADPGQKMLGPPACVTAGRFGGSGRSGQPMLYFVGGTDPARRIGSIVAGAARLAGAVTDRLLVNTSGLVDGPGYSLKRLKIDALRPDHIVVITRGSELDALLAPLPPACVHRLAPSPAAHGKSAAARAAARQAALANALRGARTHSLRDLVFEMLQRDSPTAGEACLCSLADRDGTEHALGIARDIDRTAGTATVLAPVVARRIHRVRIGMVLKDDRLAALPEPANQAPAGNRQRSRGA
jgi:polynucleotide 5'-hydroxyl-kinase GRC3/NOL9